MKFNYLLSIYNPPIPAVPRCQTQQLKRRIASHERANFLVLLTKNGSCHACRRARIYRKGAGAGTSPAQRNAFNAERCWKRVCTRKANISLGKERVWCNLLAKMFLTYLPTRAELPCNHRVREANTTCNRRKDNNFRFC